MSIGIRSLRWLASTAAMCAVVLLLIVPVGSAAGDLGAITDLGTLGGSYSEAIAVNDHGRVIGLSTTASNQFHSFVWSDGVIADLGSLGGTYTVATAINNHDQIVGFSLTPTGASRAFLWEDGVMHNLGTLGGNASFATDINDHGQIVGDSFTGSGGDHAFLWQAGSMTDLGTLGGTVSRANAINEHGQVTGTSLTRDVVPHAFLWDAGVMTDINAAGQSRSSGDFINDHRQIAGFLPDAGPGGFFWDGEMTEIGTLGGASTYVKGLSAHGTIVGFSSAADGSGHAYIWRNGALTDLGRGSANAINDHDEVIVVSTTDTSARTSLWDHGTLTDIGTLGGAFTAGEAINNHGDIAGFATTPPGDLHAFLWKR